MKASTITAGLALAVLLVAGYADARNERLRLSISEAMGTADAQAKLTGPVKFFFGSQKSPKAAKTFGTFTSNKKANFFAKSDDAACQRAFLSAMISLQERAMREGGNAVVDIHSYSKKEEFKSETEYECSAGTFVGGVALRGTVVKL
jgi:hypothetical protein